MFTKTRTLLISGAVAVALTGAGIGVADAAGSPPPPAPAPTSAPAKPAPAKHHRWALARIAHGQVTLNGKQHRKIDIQRGTVQKISATSVTIRSGDGFTATYALNGKTKIRKDKQTSTPSQLAVRDRVTVLANATGHGATAIRIVDNGPAPTQH